MSRNSAGPRRSIRNTIITLVTCSTILLLAGFAFFLYKVFDAYQRREHLRFLTSRLHYVRSELQSSDGSRKFDGEEFDEVLGVIERENATRRSGRLYVEVLDGNGNSLVRVEGNDSFFSARPPFPPPAERVDAISLSYWEPPSGKHFVLTSLDVRAGPEVRTIRVALDWSAEEELIEDFRRKAVVALLLGTLLSAFLASTIARRALRPLAEMTRAARQLQVSNLGSPVEVSDWPAELADLGSAFVGMQQRLGDSFTRLSQFSADLAHEVRTPINNAMGEAEVALREPRSQDSYRNVIESLLEELGRLARMADALLFLARAERGASSINRTVLDAGAEAAAVSEFHRLVAEEKNVSLSVNGTAILHADRDLFRRALSNLLSNALQYTPRGGSVTVSVMERERAVEVTVRDTGVGISESNQPRIFDRLFRADEARSSYPEGSGLGLSIVKSIIDLHGGKVRVESSPGSGTAITLRYPADGQMTKV